MTATQQRHLAVAAQSPAHAHRNSAEAKRALADYNERMLLCRENQHRWPDADQWHWSELRGWRRKVIHYRREMVCERCGMVAIDVIDAATGTKEPRSYKQPEGYRISADLEIERSDLRLEMVKRYVKTQKNLPVIDKDPQGTERPAEEISSEGATA